MRSARYSPVLAALGPDDLERILARGVPRGFVPGQMILVAGEEVRSLFLIEEGVVKLTVNDERHNDLIVGLGVAGDLVGELAAIEDRPQPFDVVAATTGTAIALPTDEVMAAIEMHPTAALELARSLGTKLRLLARQTAGRTSGPARARVAAHLLDLADLLGRMRGRAIEVELPFSQHELARLAGMCRETACTALRNLQNDGVIDYTGRMVRILQPDVLERISCAERGASPFR